MATTPSGNKVELQVGVDVGPMKQGLREGELEIKKFGDTVATQAGKASRSIDGLGTASQETSQKLGRSQQAYIANLQRVVAAEEAGGRNTVEYQRKLATLRNVPAEFSEPLLKQLEAIQKGQAGAGKGLVDFQQNMRATRAQANLTANALRQVPAQFTDIVTSLAGGQAPLTVLLQQGGQLKDVFGGVGAAARALGGYILGLINPFTVLAATAAALAFAYKSGAAERDAFVRSLILTGDAAGVSVTGLQNYAKAISQATGATQGLSAEALTLSVRSGLTADNIDAASTAAVRFSKDAGIALEDTIKQFVDLQNEPLKAALKLNETTNFLTRASYDQIRSFEEQGRTVEAGRVAVDAYAAAINDRADKIVENLGAFERAWIDVKDAAKAAADAAKNAGRLRDDSAEAELARLDELVRKRKEAGGGDDFLFGFTRSDRLELENLQKREASLRQAVVLEREATEERARSAEAVKLRGRFDREGLQYLDDEAKKRAKLVALQGELQRAVDVGAIKFEEAAARLLDAQRNLGPKGEDTRDAEMNKRIKQIEAAFQAEIDAGKNAGTILEAQRAAGMVGDRQYFDEKSRLAKKDAETQLGLLDSIIALRQNADLGAKDQIQNDGKLVELMAERVTLADRLGTQLRALGIQEAGRASAIVRAYEAATYAAKEYQESVKRGYDAQLSLAGRGDAVRQQLQGELQIRQKYADEIRRLERARSLDADKTPENQARYDDLIAVQRDYLGKSLSDWNNYYADLRRSQDDWRNGATRALENYSDSVADVAGQTESLLSDAFKGAEDAFVEFARTGKLEFASLADSIISDIIRIGVQQSITGQFAKAADFYGLFAGSGVNTGSVTGADMDVFSQWARGGVPSSDISRYSNSIVDKPTFFATGGNVMGEAGPEAIMPLTRTPDGNLGVRTTGGAGVTVNIIESNERGGEVQRRNDNGVDILDVFVSRVKAEVANDIRRGAGPVPAAMSDTYGLNRAPAGY